MLGSSSVKVLNKEVKYTLPFGPARDLGFASAPCLKR